MAKITAKNVVVPSVVLVLICVIISAALAVTNSFTKDKITEIDRKNTEDSMAGIFTEKGAEFKENTLKADNTEYTYYEVTIAGKAAGYVFTVANNGYGGKVNVMTGINPDGTVKAIKVLSCDDETPGLGQNAKGNEAFAKQFNGKTGKISEEKNKDIDALTGATITTKAVIKDVNKALELYSKVKGE